MEERRRLIEKLTGIRSSKKSYYVELREKIRETARRNSQLESLNELSRGINLETSLEETLELIAEKLRNVMPVTGVGLYTFEGSRLSLRASSSHGGNLPAAIPSGSLFLDVAREGRSVVREDIDRDEVDSPEDSSLRSAGFRSIALVPLVGKNVAGTLALSSVEPQAFDAGDVGFLEQVADQLAASLRNVHLYAEVLKAQREWEETFGAVTDLLAVIDSNYRLFRFNRAVPAFYDIDAHALGGVHCYKAFMGLDTPCEPCPMTEAMNLGKRAFQQVFLPSGRILDVYAYPTFGENGGQVTGAITYSKDVTQMVYSSRFVALGEMAAGVAHELNSPLTAIVGEAQILLRDTLSDDPSRELLMDISNSGFRCKRIIQNLLTFSRQEEYTFEPTDLNDVIEKTLSLVSYQIEKDRVRIEQVVQTDLPLIMACGQRLEQVLVNLLLNARDSVEDSPEKVITISTYMPSPREVAVAVRDTGKGIPPEVLPHIFDPFFTTKKPGRGTGLGLSVSMGIAEAHGGRIEVDSQPESGSTFRLLLPLRREGQ